MPSDEGDPARLASDGVRVELTHNPLDILQITDDVRSPKAGATVLFAGSSPDHELRKAQDMLLIKLNPRHHQRQL